MTNRKDKIKNIAIIFLLIMLLLTFFSNTIMNYSLVEVSTQQIVGGSITSKVRGSGSVVAGESYSVTIGESRKIATVNVRTGNEVSTGDVLFTLEDTESDELVQARTALVSAQTAYETAVLASGITVAERRNIEAGKGTSLTDKQNAVAVAQQSVVDNQAVVNAAQANVDKLQAQVDALGSTTVDTTAEDLAVLNAQRNLTAATSDVDTKNKAMQAAETAWKATIQYDASGNAIAGSDDATKKAAYDAALAAYNDALKNQSNCQKAVDDASYNLSVKKLNATNTAEANTLQAQLTAAKTTKTAADTALAAAQANLETVTSKINGEVTVASAYAAYQDAATKVAELEDNAIGAEITSPINGTVTEIAYTAGQTAEAEAALMQIQPENKAYTLSFSVTANQAKRIKAGDSAEILNNWYGNDITATVTSIRKNPNDKTTNIVNCELNGDVSVGDNYTLSIGEQSSNYDMIVPTSSIREDSNGSFILIIESKSTPLGNRYYARRVDVEIITSDDTKSAISGALEGYEFVITTTTKPVEENQQVRLPE